MQTLRAQFRPEFLNRVDDIVIFKPLTFDEIVKIADLQIRELGQRLAERRLTISLTDAAKQFTARNGFDPVFGARPLKRFIQQDIETPIARLLLSSGVSEGAEINVDVKKDHLAVDIKTDKK